MARDKCELYCCSEFANHIDVQSTNKAQLQNPLHRIFRPENFASDLDANQIIQPLRLASHILESPPMLPFVDIVMRGKLTDEQGNVTTWPQVDAIDEENDRKGGPRPTVRLVALPNQDRIDLDSKKYAKAILHALGDMVRFELDFRPAHILADCTPTKDLVPDELRKIFPRGSKSVIRINRIKYKGLTQLHDSFQAEEVCVLRTTLAVGICHE